MISRFRRQPHAPSAALPAILALLLAGACTDRSTSGATIGFVDLRGRGGAWPYLIELGDSTAMYSQATGSGWSGPVILCSSEDRPVRFRWTSSDSTVLSVDARGVVTARQLGEAEVRAVVDGVTSNAWGLRVIPAGVSSIRPVEVHERSVGSKRAFAVTTHDADGQSVPGVPFHATLMVPDRAPSPRCAGTPALGPSRNFTPCDLLVDGSLVHEPTRLRVIVPTIVGRSEPIEAEVVVRPSVGSGSGG